MIALGLADVEVDDRGVVVIHLTLRTGDSPDLAETVRLVASGVQGVTRVSVHPAAEPATGSGIAAPEGSVPVSAPATATGRAPDGHREPRRRSLPVVGPGATAAATHAGASRGQVSREEASRHPADAAPLPGVGHVIAVSSGKGGVGKSTISTNLAAAWAQAGKRVGLLDADIYGPDVPTMLGARESPRMHENRVIPVEAHGVKMMSLGLLVDEETPAIWRGPIIMGIVRQFLHQVDWGELDYLVVDLPPGTGDAQLSLVQLVKVTGAVMVTTPQDVSVAGVLKGIKMFENVEVPVIGLVENMRGFVCPGCDTTHDIFGSGGGEKLAASLGLPFLGSVPLGLAVRAEGDRGTPTVVGRSESPEGRALAAIAHAAEERIRAMA